MSTRIYVLSPNPISIADARHYYPLIINASQAIRVHTSLPLLLRDVLHDHHDNHLLLDVLHDQLVIHLLLAVLHDHPFKHLLLLILDVLHEL